LNVPDLERTAQRILDEQIGDGEIRTVLLRPLGAAIVEALRLVWNARGASR
jgi:hypothetical protein